MLYFILQIVCAFAHRNILVFMVDDMGYNDLHSFPTPTINKLSSNGILLQNHYTAITCTPSRASFLTGKYPVNTGLTSALLYNNPYGLHNHTTFPQILQENNYKTSLIGKWHLGYAHEDYLPNNNGFDNFYGILNGASDHYTNKVKNIYDLYNNTNPVFNNNYSTELYTDITLNHLIEPFFTMVSYQALHTPLQVPKKYLKKCNIKNRFRKQYCGMMVAVDKSMKKIINKLKKDNSWKNTLILFLTDNGGQPFYGASNYPYRGSKNSVFEGGTKGIAFLNGGVIEKSFKYNGLIHISDWFPTLLSFLDIKYNSDNLDGINLLDNIFENKKSDRKEMLIHYDIYSKSFCYRKGHWKIIVGNTGDSSLFGIYDSKICSLNELPIDKLVCFFNYILADKYFFLNEIIREFRNVVKKNSIGGNVIINRQIDNILLYNLEIDPYELNDVSKKYPNKTNELLKKINININNIQYPWFVADSNVKYKTFNNKLYHHPWIDINHKVEEYNFVKYFVMKIVIINIFIMLSFCFIYKKINVFLHK